MLKNEFSGKKESSLSFTDVFVFNNANEIVLYDIKRNSLIKPGDKVEMSVGEYMLNLAQAMGMEAREYLKEVPKQKNTGFSIDGKNLNFQAFEAEDNKESYKNKEKAEKMFIQGMIYLREELSLGILDEILKMSSKVSNIYEERKIEQLREMLNNYSLDKKLELREGDFSILNSVKDRLISGQIYAELEMSITMENILVDYLHPKNKELEKYFELKKPSINFNWIENIETNLEQKIEKLEVEIFKDTALGKELEDLLKKDSIGMLKKYIRFVWKNPKFHRKEDLIDIDRTFANQRKNYLEKSFDVNWQLINNYLKKNKTEDDKNEIIKSFIISLCECFDTRIFNLIDMVNLNKLINNNEILNEKSIIELKKHIKDIYLEKKTLIFSNVEYENQPGYITKEINIKSLINLRFLNGLTMDNNIELLQSLRSGINNPKELLSLRHCEIVREIANNNLEEAKEKFRNSRDWLILKEMKKEEEKLCLIIKDNIMSQMIETFIADGNCSFTVKAKNEFLQYLCSIKKEDSELFDQILFELIDTDIVHKKIWDDLVQSIYENSKMREALIKNVSDESEVKVVSRKKVSKF